MFYNNEQVGRGGYGYGGGDCGFGGGGILGMIALLALFRGDLGRGNHDGANAFLGQIQQELGSIRADIGEQKYASVTSIMESTNTLMQSICQGNYQNLQALVAETNKLEAHLNGIQQEICGVRHAVDLTKCELTKDILLSANQTNMNVLKQGFENQLANERQTYQLSKQMSDCCCETNLNIERTSFATQLRDQEQFCATNAKLKELECGQKEIIAEINKSRLIDEITDLKRENRALAGREERNFIKDSICCATGKTNCLVNQLGQSAFAYTNITTPTTPFNWRNPSCDSCCCGGGW